MENNLLNYWRNWDEHNLNIPLGPNDYLIYFKIKNKSSKYFYSDFISCSDIKKVYSFIKYVLIPSTQISSVIGVENKSVYLGTYDYFETLEILKYCEVSGFDKAISTYIEQYQIVENIEKNNGSIAEIKRALQKFNESFNCDIILHVEIFKTLKDVGEELVKIYEEKGKVSYLESVFELRKNQIIKLFKDIDKNPFMKRRIKEYLFNKLDN